MPGYFNGLQNPMQGMSGPGQGMGGGRYLTLSDLGSLPPPPWLTGGQQLMQAPQNGPGQFMQPGSGPAGAIGDLQGGPVNLPGAPTMPQTKPSGLPSWLQLGPLR